MSSSFRYITKTTTRSQFMLMTYIIKTKRANPAKRIYPFEKMISHDFFIEMIRVLIAGITSFEGSIKN